MKAIQRKREKIVKYLPYKRIVTKIYKELSLIIKKVSKQFFLKGYGTGKKIITDSGIKSLF